jgi:hypothetical protein
MINVKVFKVGLVWVGVVRDNLGYTGAFGLTANQAEYRATRKNDKKWKRIGG